VRTQELTFKLPPSLFARRPRELSGQRRDEARMLVIDKRDGQIAHDMFRNLPNYMRPGDVLVLNNSGVIPAVIRSWRGDGGQVEVRLISNKHGGIWHAVLTPSVAISLGTILFMTPHLTATVIDKRQDILNGWVLQFLVDGQPIDSDNEMFAAIEKIGRPVISMYTDKVWELDYYQNVYSSVPGSCEAPTAGRHFTNELLNDIRSLGVQVVFLTLHIGLSSVLIREENVEDHKMLEEEFIIPPETADIINQARSHGHRVFATGTTVVRSLESAVGADGVIHPQHRWTTLYISPGYTFHICDAIITNFHGPISSRLALAAAFVGWPIIKKAYSEAIRAGYQFYEFGDVTLMI